MSALPPWPEKPENYPQVMDQRLPLTSLSQLVRYEELRAEAALARLRIAVEHINHEPRCAMMQPVGKMACDCGYHEALSAIGSVPNT